MTKLAIILCAILFASAANASYWSDGLASAQQTVEGIIETTINEVRSRFETAKEKAYKIVEKLQAAAVKYIGKVSNKMSSILRRTQTELNKVTRKAVGVDVTNCTELGSQLDRTALAAVSNVSSCVVEKLESGAGYIESMTKIGDDVLVRLNELRAKARHCSDNVDGVASAGKAIFCTNAIAAKATWAAVKTVPSVSMKLAKLVYLLTTLQPSLLYCSTSNGLVTFYHESSTIVEKVKRCVEQKIEEARNGEPEAHNNTTEKHNSTTEEEEHTSSTDLHDATTKEVDWNEEHTVPTIGHDTTLAGEVETS